MIAICFYAIREGHIYLGEYFINHKVDIYNFAKKNLLYTFHFKTTINKLPDIS